MDEKQARVIYFKTTMAVMDQLSDSEVAGLNMSLALDTNPRQFSYWDKLKPLYQTENSPPTMHEEIRNIVFAIAADRLGM